MMWRGIPAAFVVAILLAAGCGSDDGVVDGGSPASTTSTTSPTPPDGGDVTPQPIALPVADRAAPSTDPRIAGRAITDFGFDLFAAARSASPTDNVSLSPASVAIALGMLEPGANGDGRSALRAALGIDDPDAYHASMNALEQELEGRTLPDLGAEDAAGDYEFRIANAAYLQTGYPFEAAYLDAVGSNYGPVLNEVDFRPDPDAVAGEINEFVAAETNDRIPELIPAGAISPDTVLALVNALYLNTSWLEPFPESGTDDEAFTRLDGGDVIVPLMSGRSDRSVSGDGWVAASKVFSSGLAMQFVLPDDGRFDEVAASLDTVIAEFEEANAAGNVLKVPRFETRSNIPLDNSLKALGLAPLYTEGNLLGVADDPRLVVFSVLHEAFVSVDEEGVEAAAATAVLVGVTSAPAEPPQSVPVILDRPFLYRIVDTVTGTTLFVGQITDPTA